LRKISRLREIVTLVCFVLLLSLIVTKLENDNDQRLAGTFRAADGDSLVLGKQRLRLKGIDAPELSQTCMRQGKPWPCGLQAKLALGKLVAEPDVACVGNSRDKYHRLLVTCRRGSLNINRLQVTGGMAVSFGDYEQEEDVAKAARRGVWAGEFLMPSAWRARHRIDPDREVPHS
jgi:endonuclease YncB( thermonuclease family)